MADGGGAPGGVRFRGGAPAADVGAGQPVAKSGLLQAAAVGVNRGRRLPAGGDQMETGRRRPTWLAEASVDDPDLAEVLVARLVLLEASVADPASAEVPVGDLALAENRWTTGLAGGVGGALVLEA